MACEDFSFDLFSRPGTDASLEEILDEEILPLTAISDSASTIEFSISGDGDQYIDLSNLRLFLKIKITKSDGGAIAKNVDLIKFWPQALFRQCDLFLNGTLCTSSSSMYGYNAYLSSVLSFPSQVKKSQLKVLEHADGWKAVATAPETEALIRLHLPLCQQERLLPNKVDIRLRLLRSADNFVFKGVAEADEFKIQLEKCSLFVRRVTPTSTLLLQHVKQMSQSNCLYPVDRIFSKFYTLQNGVREFDLPNISQGQLPNRIIVGLVKTSAFSGSKDTDPFSFQHFSLDHLSLQSNGRSFPAVPITTDFDKEHYRRAYHLLLDTVQGGCVDSESLGIDEQDYKANTCLFGIPLARTFPGPSSTLPRRESGYVNAKLRFKQPLPHNVNAIFVMEFANMVEIDSARNVYLDYAA